jgi:hypothetical protein
MEPLPFYADLNIKPGGSNYCKFVYTKVVGKVWVFSLVQKN